MVVREHWAEFGKCRFQTSPVLKIQNGGVTFAFTFSNITTFIETVAAKIQVNLPQLRAGDLCKKMRVSLKLLNLKNDMLFLAFTGFVKPGLQFVTLLTNS